MAEGIGTGTKEVATAGTAMVAAAATEGTIGTGVSLAKEAAAKTAVVEGTTDGMITPP